MDFGGQKAQRTTMCKKKRANILFQKILEYYVEILHLQNNSTSIEI